MKTKKELEKDIAKLEAALGNPHASEGGKKFMQSALQKAKRMLADAPDEGGSPSKKAGKPSKKSSALADCEELLSRAKREAKTRDEREKKREKAGLPSQLTVGESVKKEAKTVKSKVEKIDESGKTPTAKDKVMTREGVIGIIKAFVSSLSKQQAKDFLSELMKQLKDVVKAEKTVKAENGMLIVDSTGKLSVAKNNTSFNVMRDGVKVGEIKLPTAGHSKEELTQKAKKDFKEYWLKHYAHGHRKGGYQLVYNGETFAEGGEVDNAPIDVSSEDASEGENIDVFGYHTQHFDRCPDATDVFRSLTGRLSNNPLAKFKDDGIRESAVSIDELLSIEDRCLSTGMSEDDDCEKAIELAMTAQALLTDSGAPEIMTFLYRPIKNIFKVYFANETQVETTPMEEPNPQTEPIEGEETGMAKGGAISYEDSVSQIIAKRLGVSVKDADDIVFSTEDQYRLLSESKDEGKTPSEAAAAIIERSKPSEGASGEREDSAYKDYKAKVKKALSGIIASHGAPKDQAETKAVERMKAAESHIKKYFETGRTPRSAAFKAEYEHSKSRTAAKGKHIGFDKLASEVTKEYKKKGYSAKRAKAIGEGTAAKVYHEQLAKKGKYPAKAKRGAEIEELDISDDIIEPMSPKAVETAIKVFNSNKKKYGGEDGYYDGEEIVAIESPAFFKAVKKEFAKEKLKKGKDYLLHLEDD